MSDSSCETIGLRPGYKQAIERVAVMPGECLGCRVVQRHQQRLGAGGISVGARPVGASSVPSERLIATSQTTTALSNTWFVSSVSWRATSSLIRSSSASHDSAAWGIQQQPH